MDHFDQNNILCDEQHGFRTKRSCESHLEITINEIAKNMEDVDQTDIILLDFAKAFDKVPHARLLRKMNYYRVRGFQLECLTELSVILENHKSDPLTCMWYLEYPRALWWVPYSFWPISMTSLKQQHQAVDCLLTTVCSSAALGNQKMQTCCKKT